MTSADKAGDSVTKPPEPSALGDAPVSAARHTTTTCTCMVSESLVLFLC